MPTPVTPPRFIERRKPPQKNYPKEYGWILFLIAITLVMVIGYMVSHGHPYKPGDKIGYNLGLAGGIMMSTILLYPLRKRMGFMKNWIVLPKWFQLHMVFGVLGPAIIMLHSTFYIGSVNAGVAMVCMLLVSGSGIFGRFFYTKIHYGLYGRQATQKQLQSDLDGTGDFKSIFSFAPAIQGKLVEFQNYASRSSLTGKVKLWNILTLDVRAKLLSRKLIKELEDLMYAQAQEKKFNDAQMNRLDEMYFQNVEFIQNYISAVRDLAQFGTYEKLFSLWYIFHVPFVYMLVFSGIWHVVAVHMY
ncbi:MAG: hypothetical protein WCD45_03350 [Gallionella sp.]